VNKKLGETKSYSKILPFEFQQLSKLTQNLLVLKNGSKKYVFLKSCISGVLTVTVGFSSCSQYMIAFDFSYHMAQKLLKSIETILRNNKD